MRRAFTLLELLLVLAIIAVAGAVVASRLGGQRPKQAVDQAAQQVLDQAWRCRQLARSLGVTVRLRLDPAAKTVAVQTIGVDARETDPGDALPPVATLYDGAEDLTATFVRDDGVTGATTTVDVLFRPDGRCEPPGLLTLACAGQEALVRYHAGLRPALRLSAAEAAVVAP